MLLALLITIRFFAQARIIPPGMQTMQPSLYPGDRFLIECISALWKKPYNRGDIIVFYPPAVAVNGKDLSWDPPQILGRLTGLPFLPYETAFVKRVIGLPADRVEIKSGQGVFINGQLLNESQYTIGPPHYNLSCRADIGEDGPYRIRPYSAAADATIPIVVPEDAVFVLGDNRNKSVDSHIFGMVENNRIIGRAQLKFFPRFEILNPPDCGLAQPK
jgi:signal peptidase I